MATNPPLARDRAERDELVPQPYKDETFIVKRGGVSFYIFDGTRKLKGSGTAFLTDRRIVLIRSGSVKSHHGYSSFELPLELLRRKDKSEKYAVPEFCQPMFGANYLAGLVDPSTGSSNPLSTTGQWRITFCKGGCQTFVKVFFEVLREARKRQLKVSHASAFTTLISNFGAKSQDPTDPTLLYMTQPTPIPLHASNLNTFVQQPYGGVSSPIPSSPTVSYPPSPAVPGAQVQQGGYYNVQPQTLPPQQQPPYGYTLPPPSPQSLQPTQAPPQQQQQLFGYGYPSQSPYGYPPQSQTPQISSQQPYPYGALQQPCSSAPVMPTNQQPAYDLRTGAPLQYQQPYNSCAQYPPGGF